MKHIQKLRKLILTLGILAGMSMTTYAEYVLPPVTISPENAGTVTTGTKGSFYTFSATPADGYRFVKWTGTKSSGSINTYTQNPWNSLIDNFDTSGNHYTEVTAVFEEIIPVSSISLDQSAVSLSVGKTQTLTPTILPDNAAYKTVTWASSNDSVATVSNGVVTAVAEGTANITVTATNGTEDTSDDKKATCAVTVETPVDPISYITAKADPYNTGTYYATFYDSTTSYVADCEVYYATENADGRLTLEKAEGNVIKAGEGVILKATSETVTLTKTTTEASYDSLLTGSDSETTVENALVLSLGKNGVWFYKYSGTLGANKAYLAQ